MSSSIFISYASQDRDAARMLRDALTAQGFEVWYDENELGGGDAWDQKIRRQIRECTYFMPVISMNTEGRLEGYFRREWRLAVERTLDMADGVTFLVPIVIDPVPQAHARVPEKFLTVQWLSLPGGKPTPAFAVWANRLVTGLAPPPVVTAPGKALPPRTPVPPPPHSSLAPSSAPAPNPYPPFPEQHPGKALHFVFQVLGWAPRCAWIWYRNLKRSWRRVVMAVVIIAVLNRACSDSGRTRHFTTIGNPAAADGDAGDAAKLQAAENIAAKIAREFGDDTHRAPTLLAYTFVTPAGDANAERVARAVFKAIYRKCRETLPNQVGLAPSNVVDDPLKLAKERDAEKMLTGEVTGAAPSQMLQVKLVKVDTGAVLYSGNYPLNSADPESIAQDFAKQLTKDEE
jgi:hypothetical protein